MVTTANSAARAGTPPTRSAIPFATRAVTEPCEQHCAATRHSTGTPPMQLVASLLDGAPFHSSKVLAGHLRGRSDLEHQPELARSGPAVVTNLGVP